MSRVTIESVAASDFNLSNLLKPEETLLWTGQPEHGLRFFQPIGAERIYLASMAAGTVVLWVAVPLIISGGSHNPVAAAAILLFAAMAFVVVAFVNAAQRQFVLSRSVYMVTTHRAIVCRRGRNWRFSDQVFIISNPHSKTYPYVLHATRPYPSLRIGTLIDQSELQPTGLGLSHPGQPASWGHIRVPVAFEQISEADIVLNLILSKAE